MSLETAQPDFRDRASGVRPGEELDLSRLEAYLRGHFPDAGGPMVLKQFPSGHSNLTYSVTLGDREMVLRRPPFGSKVKSAHDMGREFRVLSKLHAVYPAPRALLYCTDESVIGSPFYVMERISGVVLRRDLPQGLQLAPETVRRMSESFIDNLARLHGVDYHAIGLGDLGRPEGYMERQVRGWIERYHGSRTHDLPDVDTISTWLNDHIAVTHASRHDSPATLIHNDYKYDNMILDAADITQIKGVLDWEMCTIGDPLADLGTAIAYWVEAGDPPELQVVHWGPTALPGSMTRAQLVERYGRVTGRDVSNIVFYYAFALFKTAVIIQQIYYRYHHGLTKDQRFAGMLDVTRLLLHLAVLATQRNSL